MDRDLSEGDYVYAQGGVVVGKVPEDEALPILESWKEHFFELKQVDAGLSLGSGHAGALSPIISKAERTGTLSLNEMVAVLESPEPAALYSEANRIRKEKLDNACCVHGIIEFSNHCVNDCMYCGIRCGNKGVKRYRMSKEQILSAVDEAVEKHGFKALVLQSGEDTHYTDDMLVNIVKRIREKHGILLFMSIGERGKECYQRLYDAGAYGALLRFETSSKEIYSSMRPGRELEDRLALIDSLKGMGYVLATGFLIGLPGQTKKDIAKDILLTRSLKPDMYSFGPLVPHPRTPLASVRKPSLDEALKAISLTRLVDHEAKILITSALETLAPDAARRGLLAGGNSLMIDTTPPSLGKSYDLYPGKAKDEPVEQTIKKTVELLKSLGRAPTDLGA
jgi:biotin synthase